MRYALPALAAAAAVNAQGITEYIAPKASAPPGCQLNVDRKFAIHAVPINQNNKRQLSTSTTTSTTRFTTTIPGSVVTITSHVKPTSTSTETDTITSYTTITPVETVGTTSVVPISQIGDGQIQNPQDPPASSVVPISQIGDGQIQVPSMMTVTGVNTMLSTMVIPSMVSQIGDGQIQAPPTMQLVTSVSTMTSSYTSVVPVPTSSMAFTTSTIRGSMSTIGTPMSQIGDGQVQAPPHKRAEPSSASDDDDYYEEEAEGPNSLDKRQRQCLRWVKKCHRIRNKCETYCQHWAKTKRGTDMMQVTSNGSVIVVYAEAWEFALDNDKRDVAADSSGPLYIEQIDKYHVRVAEKNPDGSWTNTTYIDHRIQKGFHDLKQAFKSIFFGSESVKREIQAIDAEPFACASATNFQITLSNGTLTDAQGRTGAIVGNRQFQFDGPAQSGSIYTGGFSVCENGSLALGGSTVFYSCASGSFSNLYDTSIGGQCVPVHLQAIELAEC